MTTHREALQQVLSRTGMLFLVPLLFVVLTLPVAVLMAQNTNDNEDGLFGLGIVDEDLLNETAESNTGDFSLSVNDANVGDTIRVNWTAPNRAFDDRRSWIGIYEPGARDRDPIEWERIGDNQTSGTWTVVVDRAGEYEVRLYRGATYDEVAQTRVNVGNDTGTGDNDDDNGTGDDDGNGTGDDDDSNTGDFSLSVNDANVGDTIRVNWTAPNRAFDDRRSWIGIYEPGARDRDPIEWERIGDNQTSGTWTVVVDRAGEYEVRLYRGATYDEVAQTRVNVGNDTGTGDNDDDNGTGDDDDNGTGDDDDSNTGDFSLSVNDANVGDTIRVDWTAPNRAFDDRRSWIGIYEPGARDRDPIEWERIGDNQTSGTWTVVVDRAGEYEVRLYRGATYDEVAQTRVNVSGGSGDPGDDDNDNDNPGDNDGIYDGYDIDVAPMRLNVGNSVTVRWNGPPGDTNNEGPLEQFNNDWIGMYQSGASDRDPYKWERVRSPSGAVSFEMNREGTYEVRYFRGATYDSIFESDSIVVGDGNNNLSCNGIDLRNVTNYPNNNGPIIALGDSLTAGVGASNNDDYVSELEKQYSITILNAGIRGDTTEDMLMRLNGDVLSRKPSTVIVFAGGNDELRRQWENVRNRSDAFSLRDELEDVADNAGYNWEDMPLYTRDQSFNNLRLIVERIQAQGAEVILVGFDLGIISSTVDDRFEEVADQTGAVLVPDIYDDVFGRPNLMSDLVHPNDQGYEIFADRIGEKLECLIP